MSTLLKKAANSEGVDPALVGEMALTKKEVCGHQKYNKMFVQETKFQGGASSFTCTIYYVIR